MSRHMEIEGDLLDHLLIIQSLMEHEKRLKSIEQKINLIVKELSILEVIFDENREGRSSLSIGSESRITSFESFVYFEKLLKILEIMGNKNESEGRM